MNKIEKNGNVCIFNGFEYILQGNSEIISESQAVFGTNIGDVLWDLSCTINAVEYTDINEFANALTDEILL